MRPSLRPSWRTSLRGTEADSGLRAQDAFDSPTMTLLTLIAPSNTGLPWLDLVGLVLVGALCLLGFMRGLWWQVVRLLGIAAAVGAARALAPRVTPQLLEFFPEMNQRLGHGLVWFGIFVLGLVLVSLIGLLGKKSLEVMQLGFADRMGGGLAGFLTAILVHAALLVALLHLGPEEWTQGAMRDTTSRMLLDTLSRKVPLVVDTATADRLAPWLLPTEEGVHAADRQADPVEEVRKVR